MGELAAVARPETIQIASLSIPEIRTKILLRFVGFLRIGPDLEAQLNILHNELRHYAYQRCHGFLEASGLKTCLNWERIRGLCLQFSVASGSPPKQSRRVMSSFAEDLESAHPGAAGMAPGKLTFWNPRGVAW